MESIVNLNKIADKKLLERFERLADIIPKCMDGISENPFIHYIKESGKVRESLIDFMNQSDFLEQLTPELIRICKELFDIDADTEWYKLLLFVMEEREEAETVCDNILSVAKKGIDCTQVRDVVEKYMSVSDIVKELAIFVSEECTDREKGNEDACDDGNDVEQNHSTELCDQQRIFISQLMKQIDDLNSENKELVAKVEAVAFQSEFAENVIKDDSNGFAEKIEALEEKCETIELQLHNAVKSRQEIYERLIEQKKVTLGYQVQVEKLKKNAVSEDMKEKCKELEDEVKAISSQKQQLESEMQNLMSDQEMLQKKNEQQEKKINELQKELSQKDEEIGQLSMQMELLEEQASEHSAKESVFITDPKSELDVLEDEEIQEEDEFPETKKLSFESGIQAIKRKSNWFANLIAQHSKKSFLKNSRQDQENLIFIKMMEMHYPGDKVQKIKKALAAENIPCFELYKMICKDASIEELDMFFEEYINTPDKTEADAILT